MLSGARNLRELELYSNSNLIGTPTSQDLELRYFGLPDELSLEPRITIYGLSLWLRVLLRIHFVPSGRAPGYLLFVFVVPVFIPHSELGERLVN